MSDGNPAIIWFRRDLRLADNPAVDAALAGGRAVVPVYILDEEEAGAWAAGGASRWWLHQSLVALGGDVARLGNRLVLRRGPAAAVLARLVRETGASRICRNICFEPWAMERDHELDRMLGGIGVEVRRFNGGLLHEPRELRTKGGGPFRVFSPFWRALRAGAGDFRPLAPMPTRLPAPATFPESEALESWGLDPRSPDWAGGMRAAWTPGEAGAGARLAAFVGDALDDYRDRRDLPGAAGTSRLSPHLHFGEIGPRQIWEEVAARYPASPAGKWPRGPDHFLSQVAWREFSHHLLCHHPRLPEESLRREFEAFGWRRDDALLARWRRGETGYPIVDAGMRELWTTGWMHNRVRMIAASFLVKDLLVHWREGEDWFWDTLVDADLASNAASWQWVAGCGADAAPYFRIFNPVLQSRRFDPDGNYLRRWVPELARLPDALLHAPWTAKPLEREAAAIGPGTYPDPIVDHAGAREQALRRFEAIRARPLHDPEAGQGSRVRRQS